MPSLELLINEKKSGPFGSERDLRFNVEFLNKTMILMEGDNLVGYSFDKDSGDLVKVFDSASTDLYDFTIAPQGYFYDKKSGGPNKDWAQTYVRNAYNWADTIKKNIIANSLHGNSYEQKLFRQTIDRIVDRRCDFFKLHDINETSGYTLPNINLKKAKHNWHQLKGDQIGRAHA